MRRKIRCDCAADPPGELITSATACACGTENARSSKGATLDMANPERSGIAAPMAPLSRTTGTTGWRVRKRLGRRKLRRSRRRAERDFAGMNVM